ncbi:10083_t:CDS:2 [Ambispora gerdemannii]|uniref:10083_t:CDS:1 n=1 Tax=Ambispora gerdemannii TaxID=144530 RepID=A0A9N8ZBM6_9GLOM|nr:10083_t:CDS:2 [Ambispora gerdemannii]
MPPNPPENFETVLPTLIDRNSLSKKRPNVPYNGSVDFSTRNSSVNKLDDGPKMDTNYIIGGYQQRQGPPTRKRGSIASDHAIPLNQQTILQPHNGNYMKNGYNGLSGMSPPPSINFGYQYKPNNLLGKLRQKTYEEVYKEKVIPASPVLHNNNTAISGRVANLFGYIFGSVNIDTIRFIVYCLLWYASSAITNNSGKQILNQFRYPITLTWVQFGFVLFYCYGFANWMGLTQLKSPTKLILLETIPLSLFQIIGHVFSSVATSHVPVSFVHTIKALSPLFTVLLYRFIFRVRYSSSVYVSLLPLTIGVMLACSSHSTSNFIGFLFAMGSTLIFVAQNIFSKKLLFNQDHGGGGSDRKKLDKLNLMFYSSTFAFALMTPMWLYYDGIHLIAEQFWPQHVHHPHIPVTSGWTVAFYFFVNGTTHFAQNILAFSILAITSPVTYSIASLVKRIFVITASIVWFGQSTTFMQGIGICLTFTGLYMYNKAKRDVDRKEKKAREEEEIILPLTRSESELDLKRM